MAIIWTCLPKSMDSKYAYFENDSKYFGSCMRVASLCYLLKNPGVLFFFRVLGILGMGEDAIDLRNLLIKINLIAEMPFWN